MGIAAETEYIPDHLIGTSVTAFESMVNILNALGNHDALAIFTYVENKIPSSKIAIQELGLTQKRFYSRLKDLIDVGLIEKSEGMYQYTTLGRIFSKIGLSLLDVLENKDQFELLERLRENSTLTSSDFNKITSVVSKGSSDVSGIFNLLFLSENQGRIEVFSSYESFVEKLDEVVNGSKKSIYLASRYLDNKVIDSMINVSNKGITTKVLMASEHLEEKINKLQLLLSPGALLTLLEFFCDPNLDEIMRDGDMPFSFAVIDHEQCFFELPNFENNNFSIAFYVMDNEIGNKFCEMFSNFWENADRKSIPKMFKKLNKSS
jgi:predicted transcriptional regulator